MSKQPVLVKEAFLDAMAVSGSSIKGAEYFVERAEEVLTDPKYESLLQAIKDFAKHTIFKLSSSSAQSWSGQQAEVSGFKNMQINMANDALNNLDIEPGNSIKFDYAVDNNAHFLRGFSAEGQAVQGKELEALDTMFNAWLAKNDVISKNGTLYQAQDNGQIRLDKSGQPIPADAAKIQALIANADKGFDSYMQTRGVSLTSEQHEYPSPQQNAQKQQAVSTATSQVDAVDEYTQPSTPL